MAIILLSLIEMKDWIQMKCIPCGFFFFPFWLISYLNLPQFVWNMYAMQGIHTHKQTCVHERVDGIGPSTEEGVVSKASNSILMFLLSFFFYFIL